MVHLSNNYSIFKSLALDYSCRFKEYEKRKLEESKPKDQTNLTGWIKRPEGKYKKTDLKQREHNKRLVKMIVGCHLPFHLVEQPEFIDYSVGLDPKYTVPTR